MNFNINDFRISVPDGLARPSLFEVFFPALPNVPGAQFVQDTPVKVAAASVPTARVQSIDIYYMGRPIPVIGERIFDPWRVRVYNSEDYGLRDFFEGWSNRGNTLIGNRTELTNDIFAQNGGYKVDHIIARQFAKHGEKIRGYEFFGMYPEVVGDIELGWERGNQFETFDVMFRYDFWVPSTTDGDQTSPGTYDIEGTDSNASGAAGLANGAVSGSPNVITVG